jgi:hypothetical protein
MRSDCQLPLGEWRRRYLNNILSIYNFPERKITSYKKFIPVDIATLANVKEDEWFGEPDKAPQLEKGRRNIAFIPMNINKGDKLALATAPEGGEQVIPLERRGVKSLFFLQGLYLNKEKRKDFKKRSSKYMYGVPCAEIRIEYTDGPTEIIPIRAGIETNEITPFWNSRYMFGCRYTLETDTKDKTRAALYMLEWENPYRFRTIKNIVWKSYGTEAIPVLFAVTAGF